MKSLEKVLKELGLDEESCNKYWRNMPIHKRFWKKVISPFFSKKYDFFRYDIPNGIKGLLYWSKFAWNWRSWDWAFGMRAFQLHLKALEQSCRNGHHVNGKRDADEIKQALFLIDRILNDDYYWQDDADCLSEHQNNKVKFSQSQRDLAQLTRILRKKMFGWWD